MNKYRKLLSFASKIDILIDLKKIKIKPLVLEFFLYLASCQYSPSPNVWKAELNRNFL